jgi:hypothetical protein
VAVRLAHVSETNGGDEVKTNAMKVEVVSLIGAARAEVETGD